MGSDQVSLNVCNKSNNQQYFSVKIDDNVTITNFDEERNPERGEIKTTVQDGTVTNIFVDKKGTHNYNDINLSSTKFNILNALRALDEDAGNLTEDDCKNAKTLVGQFGITSVEKLSGKKYVIKCGDGKNDVLVIDFETPIEKATRIVNEKINNVKKAVSTAIEEKKAERAAKKEENFQNNINKIYEQNKDKYILTKNNDGLTVTLKEHTNVWDLATAFSADPSDIVYDNCTHPDIDLGSSDRDTLRGLIAYCRNTDTSCTGEYEYKNIVLHAGETFEIRKRNHMDSDSVYEALFPKDKD